MKKKKPSKREEATLDLLVQEAKAVRQLAYAPYSKYKVGAALMTKSGGVFVGCNVENASYPAGICAERGAIMAMAAAGEHEPIALAIVTADGGSPCGICRQVLSEFAKDLPIALVAVGKGDDESGRVVRLADIMPMMFALKGTKPARGR
jgi:cytidine deaminase